MSWRDEILAQLGGLLRQELDRVESLRIDSRLAEDLGLDSIQLMTLAVAVEDHFEICLDEAEERSIVTVGDLVETIAAHRQGSGSRSSRA